MGNNYNTKNKKQNLSAEYFLAKFEDPLKFDRDLGKSILKSCVAKTKEGQPLVCKIYNKPNDLDPDVFNSYYNYFIEIKETINLDNSPNIAPIIQISYEDELVHF